MTGTSFFIQQQLTSVRLCATSNLSGAYYNGKLNNGVGATLTANNVGALSLDSTAVSLNDRVVLPAQTNSNENGIYVVTSPGSSTSFWQLQRSDDFQSLEQLKSGQYFSINSGSTLAGNMMVLIEPLPLSIGGLNSSGITFVNVTTGGGSGGGPFLRIANNLSDLSNLDTSYENFGLGSGTTLSLTDSDFSGGIYQLTNPCPNVITLNCSSMGNSLLFPLAQGSQAFGLYQGPEIINIGSQRVNTASFLGIPQTPSLPGDDKIYRLTDNSTTGGTWDAQGNVIGILGNTGDVSLLAGANIDITNNNDGSVTIAAISGPSAVTSGQANFFSPTNTTTSTTFAGTGIATPVLVNSVSVLYQNNFNVTLSAGTPNVHFLTAATRQCLINAVFTLRTSSVLSQTYTVYLVINNGMSSVMTGPIATLSISPSSGGPLPVTITTNLALTGPGDNLQFWISNDSGTTDPVFVRNLYVTILDTTQFGGFSSTDVLPQGVNNLYLSQDGGATYQNVQGLPVVTDNLASFNATSGKLKDSGIPSSNVVLTTGNQTIDGIKTFIAPELAYEPSIPGDGSALVYEQLTSNVTNNTDQGAGLDIWQDYFYGTTPAGTELAYFWSTGFNFEDVGGSSGYAFLQILDKGVRNNVLKLQGGDSSFGARAIFGGTNPSETLSSFSIGLNSSSNPHLGALFEVSSTTQGALLPSMTNAQMNAINVSDTPTGLIVYANNTTKGLHYWDSSWNLVLSNSNVTGNVTFSSSGVATIGSNQIVPSMVSSGTYNIDISGNAATATTALTAGLATTATTANNVATSSITTNANFFLTFVALNSSTSQNVDVTGGLSFNPSTNILSTTGLKLSGLSASSLVATDGSSNLVSQTAYGILSFATVTGSTQSMSLNTRYINNYSGGQCVYSLPAATGSGKQIDLQSLSTASTSGWKVNANGTDVIQFGASVSAAGGSLTSTTTSATDCATFTDVASGKWIVYPALGLNLVVT